MKFDNIAADASMMDIDHDETHRDDSEVNHILASRLEHQRNTENSPEVEGMESKDNGRIPSFSTPAAHL